MSNYLQSEISNLQSQISNLKSPISNLQSPISNLQSPISNLQSQMENDYSLLPKIAVPTRTIVAPSSIATSKSWLIPMDKSVNFRSAVRFLFRPSNTSRSFRK